MHSLLNCIGYLDLSILLLSILALHTASSNGCTELLDILMKKGASINATDYNGSTSLHMACQKGQQGSTVRNYF